MLDAIVESFLTEVILALTLGVGLFLARLTWKNRSKFETLEKRITQVEQQLFGFRKDESDEGYVKESKNKINQIDEKVDKLDSNVKKIDEKVDKTYETVERIREENANSTYVRQESEGED